MHADGSRKIALHFVVSVAIRAFRSVLCGRRSEVPFGSPFWRVPGSETVRRRVRANPSSHNRRLTAAPCSRAETYNAAGHFYPIFRRGKYKAYRGRWPGEKRRRLFYAIFCQCKC